jgi:hypothetical protein
LNRTPTKQQQPKMNQKIALVFAALVALAASGLVKKVIRNISFTHWHPRIFFIKTKRYFCSIKIFKYLKIYNLEAFF